MTSFMCPVCGFPDLDEAPYSGDGTPSYEFCECCGFQFGYHDESDATHTAWRMNWIADGCAWQSVGIPAPEGWDPVEQLKNLDL